MNKLGELYIPTQILHLSTWVTVIVINNPFLLGKPLHKNSSFEMRHSSRWDYLALSISSEEII